MAAKTAARSLLRPSRNTHERAACAGVRDLQPTRDTQHSKSLFALGNINLGFQMSCAYSRLSTTSSLLFDIGKKNRKLSALTFVNQHLSLAFDAPGCNSNPEGSSSLPGAFLQPWHNCPLSDAASGTFSWAMLVQNVTGNSCLPHTCGVSMRKDYIQIYTFFFFKLEGACYFLLSWTRCGHKTGTGPVVTHLISVLIPQHQRNKANTEHFDQISEYEHNLDNAILKASGNSKT